jgi:prolyl 4-hydroxylase
MQEDNNKGTLFCDVNPHRSLRPGWMGHLAAKQRTSSSSFKSGNCQIFPIALPLCALVATKEIMEGTTLELEAISTPPRSLPKKLILERYRPEIQELQEYMKMAFPKEPPPPPLHEDDDDDDKVEAPQKEEPPSSFSKLHHPFYDFPLLGDAHPSATFVRTDPDILVVPNFLSDSECDRLIQKCRPHLVPCVTKNPRTGAVEEDGSRTSRNTNVPQEEVPSIVHKLTQLTNCDPEQLEVLQVLHYAPGQYFEPHTDGFAGPISACGFEASARLVTIFCYLNDVKQGGATRFSNLDLNIEPQKGLAVIHFPTTLGFEEDGRTHHEGMVAIDEKWLLVTWVWMHPRDQTSIYAEKWLDPLDDEII